MLDFILKWKLNKVAFQHTAFNVFTGNTFDTRIFNADDFTLTLDDFYLDSTVVMTEDNVFFTRDIQLVLNKPVKISNKNGQRHNRRMIL